MLESDAQLVVNAVKKDIDCCSWFGTLINKAKLDLKTWPLWNLLFTQWEGNHTAHVMAKFDLSLDDECIWINEIPSILSYIVVTIERLC